jgi:hypothetical protein
LKSPPALGVPEEAQEASFGASTGCAAAQRPCRPRQPLEFHMCFFAMMQGSSRASPCAGLGSTTGAAYMSIEADITPG